MRVALITSVVALVAVSQPYPFDFPVEPFQPCHLIGGRQMQCCWPEVFGGCRAPPGAFPPGLVPAGYLPPPDFLRAVCCPKGRECCPRDRMARNPIFTCCGEDQSCNIVEEKGTCIDGNAGNGTTPDEVEELDLHGRCPVDGSRPIFVRPGQVFRCTLNTGITGFGCPSGTSCVRDNSGNVNSGVCCRSSGCERYSNCTSCVRNEERVNAPCGWLSQGSLENTAPRCVSNCYNFPDKSCILPSNGRLCPASDANPNGTIVNTGSCDRRCGLVGTGRSDRITNNGNIQPVDPNVNKTRCCGDYPGDYCCNAYGTLAAHCSYGQVVGGPLCGVPIKGTPNNFYNEPLNPYNPYYSPYGLPGAFTPYGGVIAGPYGTPYGGFGPQPYPFVPTPYAWNPYGREGLEKTEAAEKNLYFAPPPVYYPPSAPMWRPRPPIVSQRPSQFVCSCDADCTMQDDCCADYEELCVLPETSSPTASPTEI